MAIAACDEPPPAPKLPPVPPRRRAEPPTPAPAPAPAPAATPEVAAPAAKPRPVVLSGRLVDSRGAAVGFASVLAQCSVGCPLESTTDEAGGFSFSGLPPGTAVKLQARTERARSAWVPAVVPQQGLALQVPAKRRVLGKVQRAGAQPVGEFHACGEVFRSRDGTFECTVAAPTVLISTAESDVAVALPDEPAINLGTIVAPDLGKKADENPESGHHHHEGDHAATPANLLAFARNDLRYRRAESAMEYLDMCLKVAPKQPECLKLRGSAFAWLGKWRDAAKAYRAALAVLGPKDKARASLMAIATAIESEAERAEPR